MPNQFVISGHGGENVIDTEDQDLIRLRVAGEAYPRVVIDATGTKTGDGTAEPSQSGASGAGLLGKKMYAPAVVAAVGTTSSTFADVDATNLVVSFTAPSSGEVIVVLTSNVDVATATILTWCLFDGGVLVPGSAASMTYLSTTTTSFQPRVTSRVLITGLTPNQAYTWTWAHARTFGTGNARTRYGGDPAAAEPGPALMEVWSGNS